MKSMKLTSNYYSLLSFTQYGQRRRGYGAQQPDVPVRISQPPDLHVSRIHDEKRRKEKILYDDERRAYIQNSTDETIFPTEMPNNDTNL